MSTSKTAAKEIPQDEFHALYCRSFAKGESVMGYDIAKIIGIRRLRKYGMDECARVLADLLERCGGWCDEAQAREDLEMALL